MSAGEFRRADELHLVWDDPTPTMVPITIGKEEFLLVEVLEDYKVKWENMNLRAAKMTDGKVTGIDGLADSEPYLVHLCLFIPDQGGNLRVNSDGAPDIKFRVPLKKVCALKQEVVKGMYDLVLKISKMEKETVEVLEKRIAADQKRLAELRDKEREKQEGNFLTDSGDTSSTA